MGVQWRACRRTLALLAVRPLHSLSRPPPCVTATSLCGGWARPAFHSRAIAQFPKKGLDRGQHRTDEAAPTEAEAVNSTTTGAAGADEGEKKGGVAGTLANPFLRIARISKAQAMSDYLLEERDLNGLPHVTARTPFSFAKEPLILYSKADVQSRAWRIWGGREELEREKAQRQSGAFGRGSSAANSDDEEGEDEEESGWAYLMGSEKHARKQRQRALGDHSAREGRLQRLRGSARVVFYAIVSNALVMTGKFAAYAYTGSASMLSEGIHSAADLANQCMLAVGIARSIKAPDPQHPYGFSRARYVFALISGTGIFCLGAGVSIYHGISGLFHPHTLDSLPVAYSMLGGTLIAAYRQVLSNARATGTSFKDYILRGTDPNDVAVLLEDSAAVAGVLVAGACVGLSHYTGNSAYDSIGSIVVGLLLGKVAVFLIARNADALVGRSIPPDRLRRIMDVLDADAVVSSIHDVKADGIGADVFRFKAEINFDGRAVTRRALEGVKFDEMLAQVRKFEKPEEMEEFLLSQGSRVVDQLGHEVDRIEQSIKSVDPDVRHVDLEIL